MARSVAHSKNNFQSSGGWMLLFALFLLISSIEAFIKFPNTVYPDLFMPLNSLLYISLCDVPLSRVVLPPPGEPSKTMRLGFPHPRVFPQI